MLNCLEGFAILTVLLVTGSTGDRSDASWFGHERVTPIRAILHALTSGLSAADHE